jgi:hypothetical protein
MLVDVWLVCWFKGLSVGLVLLVCECVVILRPHVGRCVVSLLV